MYNTIYDNRQLLFRLYTGPKCNTIYIIQEPEVLEDTEVFPVRTIKFTWDEDDCETLFVDPNGLLYLVSKVDIGATPRLYLVPQQWPYPESRDDDRIPLIGGNHVFSVLAMPPEIT